MLTAVVTSIKKLFGVHVDVHQTTKRSLEEESEDECEEFAFDSVEPQPKKRRLSVHQQSSTASNDASSRLSSLLMHLPWFPWKKETVESPDAKMKRNRRQDEGTIGKDTAQHRDEVTVLEEREPVDRRRLMTGQPPPVHSDIADFRFVPSSTPSMEPDFPSRHKSWNSGGLKELRSKPGLSKTKSDPRGSSGGVLDRLLGRKKFTGFLSSRIRHSVVQKSFRHEEKMKYLQLLQQYTEHHVTPRHVNAAASLVSKTYSSSPIAPVTTSRWTPGQTKEKRATMEKESQPSPALRPHSSRLSSSGNIDGSKIFDVEDDDVGEASSCRHIPVIDISNDDDNTRDKESDDESVVVVEEVPSPHKKSNSLEDSLREMPVYNLDWVKSLRREYEDRASTSQKAVEATRKNIEELEQKRTQKLSFYDKVADRLKLLDLSYPNEYTELSEEEEETPLVPLTHEMENEIDNALSRSPASEVLVEKFHIQITRRDIKTLDGLNWLNDEVINFYLNLIMERSHNIDNYPSVYAFNTFFYPKLSKSGYQSVRRWTKKVDVFRHDLLLIPIHLGMHWCMSVVDFKQKCITYYDSMLGNNQWCLQSLLEYLEDEHRDKKTSPYDTSDWKLENDKDIPQQMNGSDCGMFACKFAEYLSRRAKINFDQEHMPYFRRRMVYEIINAKLL